MCSVRIVSPPPKDSSGVGKYSDILAGELKDEAAVKRTYVPAESTRPLRFAGAAIDAGTADEDVVHVQFDYVIFGSFSLMTLVFFPILFVLKQVYDTDVVVTMHEALNPELVESPFRSLKRLYVSVLNRCISEPADRVIFLSDRTESIFERYLTEQQPIRVPHGVPKVATSNRTQRGAKEFFGYREDETLIVEPGYVDPRKGSHVFKKIASEMPQFNFMLAGGSPRAKHDKYAADVAAEAPSNLEMTGVLDDDAFHLSFQAADLVVLPYQETEQSGVTNVVAQSGVFNLAIGYELPIVASDCPYFRTIEAQWGCIKTFDDVDNATVVISNLLADDDKRERLKNAADRFRETNDFQRVAHRHLSIYSGAPEGRDT